MEHVNGENRGDRSNLCRDRNGAFGVHQLAYGTDARWIAKLPAWVPAPAIWPYLTGGVFVACAAAILFSLGNKAGLQELHACRFDLWLKASFQILSFERTHRLQQNPHRVGVHKLPEGCGELRINPEILHCVKEAPRGWKLAAMIAENLAFWQSL